MIQFVIQIGSYIIAGIIPYFMIKVPSGSFGYLFYFPVFFAPIMTILYFFGPVRALGLLIFSTIVGTCGFLFTFNDIEKGVPSPLIFLVQIGWLWISFYLAEKHIESKDQEIHRLQEETEKLELSLSDCKQQQNDLANFCEGIQERIARYAQLQSFTDQIASSLQLREIQDKTEHALKKLFEAKSVAAQNLVKVDFFASPDSSEKYDPLRVWIFKHRIPLLVEDCSQDSRFSMIDFKQKGSVIACPIERENLIVGTIRVESPLPKNWKEEDLRFLSDISNTVSLSVANAIYYTKVESLAVTDALTGLYVRYRFDERLEEEFARSKVNQSALSLVLFDIDYFKRVNDRWGHGAGDIVLKTISKIILTRTRETDFCARYGGEELAVIMPMTTLENAFRIAERIRQDIAGVSIGEEKIRVTISGGVASLETSHRIIQDLIESADRALYLAKSKGRDQIVKGG